MIPRLILFTKKHVMILYVYIFIYTIMECNIIFYFLITYYNIVLLKFITTIFLSFFNNKKIISFCVKINYCSKCL